jgi:hypothetical protein
MKDKTEVPLTLELREALNLLAMIRVFQEDLTTVEIVLTQQIKSAQTKRHMTVDEGIEDAIRAFECRFPDYGAGADCHEKPETSDLN